MRLFAAVIALSIPTMLFASSTAELPGGGATPAEALERLQKGAAARDIVEMTAALERENRGMFLGDLYILAAALHAGEVEGVKSDPAQAKALLSILDELVGPAFEANPIDPSVFEGRDETSRMIIILQWGISRLPARDAIRLARVIDTALSKVEHAEEKQLLDAYLSQVPRGKMTINRKTDTGVWAEADGRPLGVTVEDGRWYAGGVWYTTQKFKIEGGN